MYFTIDFIKRIIAELKTCPNIHDEYQLQIIAQRMGLSFEEVEVAAEYYVEKYGA